MNGKVVVITGASSGIGKACAYAFAGKGARLVLAARSIEGLDNVKKELSEKGIDIITVPTDVTKEEDCRILIDKTIEHFGGVDVLINNAGISMRALFTEAKLEVIRQVMDVNFWGTVYCTKFALPYLIKNKGSLVGVSSIAGYKGLPARTGYSASKFAMQGFMECIRIENLKKGLHVLVACPGFTASNIRNTALTADGTTQGKSPLEEGKIMQPEEVAEEILNAVIKRKREIILTRQGKLTVLLNKFFPAWMDGMVFKTFAKEPDSPLK